ncbi:hypothetical protein [Streptomyces sp. EN16]|uniref:hypothetical protein n=1 Tax=Streptomyces sp. EN16 TaxID=212773 RepID=UPI0008519E34|nr:hypothetical protein [Streptomyces sp. EN16]
MTTRRPLGTGPVPAVDTQGAPPPGSPVPRAVLAAERLNGVATVPPVARPAGRRPLSTGPTTTG